MLRVLLAIGAVQMMAMVVLLARTKGLALLLGPDQVGILAVIDKLVAVLVQTASLSLPFAAVRFLPALWDADRREFHVRLRAMSVTLAALSLVAMVVGVVVTMIDPERWGRELQPYRFVVFVAFFTVPVQVLVPFVQNAVAAGFVPRRSMFFYLAHAIVFTVSAVVGAWWSGLSGIFLLYAALGSVFAGVALVRLNKPTDPSIRLPPPTLSTLALPAPVWRFSLAFVGLAFLMPYAALFIHYRILTDQGANAAGWMQAAIGIALAVRGVLGSAHPTFLTPQLTRGGTPEERMRWAGEFQKTFCILTGIVLPPLLLFPDVAVRLLYSPAFLPGARFVFIFVLVEIVILLAGTYQVIVLALNRIAFHVGQNLVAQLITIAVGATAIPTLGIAGAGLATLSAQVFLYISTTTFLRRTFQLRLSARTSVITLYLVAMLVTCGVAGRFPAEMLWTAVAARLGLYVVLAGGLLLFLTAEDHIKLRQLFQQVSGRFLSRQAP